MAVRVVTIGLTLLLAACSRPSGLPTEAETATPVAKPAAETAAPVAPPAPVRPEGADAADAALAEAKAFNAKATQDLAAVARDEGRIRAAAGRAIEAARRGQAARVTSARGEAEQARAALVAGLAAFETASAAQTATMATATEQCAATPELAAYEGCVALAAEQALLVQNVAALQARYEAAETAWRTDRPRLDEASATVALGALR